MKKILITGALGFIGRSLIDCLISNENNIQIFGIDIKEIPNDSIYLSSKIHYERVDIRSYEQVDAYFSKHSFDGIIHLAAVSRVVEAENDKQNCIDTNYFGTKYIAQCGAKNRNTWMIFSSSREVYGEQKMMPVCESAEKTPLNIYGFYKLEGERLIEKYFNNYFILRFSNVYGNSYDISDRVIPRFIQNALEGRPLLLEGGGQIIDFTYIADTVNSIVKCIELLSTNKSIKESIHILPGYKNKITDVITILEDEIGVKLNVTICKKRNYDVEKFVGDNRKRKKLLGDVDFTTLKEGIRLTMKSRP